MRGTSGERGLKVSRHFGGLLLLYRLWSLIGKSLSSHKPTDTKCSNPSTTKAKQKECDFTLIINEWSLGGLRRFHSRVGARQLLATQKRFAKKWLASASQQGHSTRGAFRISSSLQTRKAPLAQQLCSLTYVPQLLPSLLPHFFRIPFATVYHQTMFCLCRQQYQKWESLDPKPFACNSGIEKLKARDHYPSSLNPGTLIGAHASGL